ncbi:MAG: cytochrome-c peroxidase, partial [Planctomycetia bacterium]|nr:cytochrome-c peroxidase [Planctomycetia bacterium]
MKAGLFIVFGIATAIALDGAYGQSAAGSRDEHGATQVDLQIKHLEQLQQGTNPAAIPPGVDAEYWKSLIPEGNDTTPARVALGKKLYFEKKLSLDSTVSCATCHDVSRGFGDALPTSEGVDKKTAQGMMKQFGTRNAPTTMNIALLHTMFWDGRSPSVEHQAMQPIINPVEMGMPEKEMTIIAKIKDDPTYKKMFQAAYGRDVNYKDIGNAIAVFERTFVFMDSPFSRFLKGDDSAISEDAKAGWVLFNREGRCNSCHQISPTNPLGTDNKFHNIGVAAKHQDFAKLASQAASILAHDSSDAKLDELALSTDMGELGRFLVTKNTSDMGS